jgi:hypothetical protein
VRTYARDSVRPGLSLDFRGGFVFRFVLRRSPLPPDTVFRTLSFRDFLELGPRLDKLFPDEPRGGTRARRGRTGVRVGPR